MTIRERLSDFLAEFLARLLARHGIIAVIVLNAVILGLETSGRAWRRPAD